MSVIEKSLIESVKKFGYVSANVISDIKNKFYTIK